MENKQDENDKVIKKNFLGDINIDSKELKKENEKYYSENDESTLLKMMSIKIARIERLVIYSISLMLIGFIIVAIICD